jgi:ribA/ribD-fused uncharacterized protein
MTITFSGLNCEYWVFSNFAALSFELDGKTWASSEHYYQAMKFEGTPYSENIRLADSPSTAKKLGKAAFIRLDWDLVKEEVMKKALLAKFRSNEFAKEILLETGDEIIVEASPWDNYWGTGKDGDGQNRLGYLLMEVREILKNEESDNS